MSETNQQSVKVPEGQEAGVTGYLRYLDGFEAGVKLALQQARLARVAEFPQPVPTQENSDGK